MKSFFNSIISVIKGFGLFLGSILSFIFYGLVGYFFFWVLSAFSLMFIDWGWITNEYVIEGIRYLFVEYRHINEVIIAGAFGIIGVAKMLSND